MTEKVDDGSGGMQFARRTILAGTGIAILGSMMGGTAAMAANYVTKAGRFGFAPADIPEGFLLDGKPFQIRSGELHPARIPREHWRQRIQMAKAMGLNTIAALIMWNHHETEPGNWDFSTGNRDLKTFFNICKEEGILVYLRPGPYICAEWEWGGFPHYLLKEPGIRPREADDPIYVAASKRYIARLAKEIRPHMVDKGGPIIMVQVENEYASFGTDLNHLEEIRNLWIEQGIKGPFAIADGLPQIQKAKTYLPGTALGLDGSEDFAAARLISQGFPVWVGEGYPGWLTHWGEDWAKNDYRETLKMLMRERISFNIYLAHGGTNFGWGAGSNSNGDGSKFEPSITSYDYGAPTNEHGAPNEHYHDFRKTIYDGIGQAPPPIPTTPKLVSFPPVATKPVGSLWNAMPAPVATTKPQPMELLLGQYTGLILYRTQMPAGTKGTLTVDGLHDEAIVLVDGQRIGSLSRVAAAKAPASLTLPDDGGQTSRQLDILVYPFGRVNYGRYTADRKGIIGSVNINGHAITDWQVFGFPLDDANVAQVRAAKSGQDGLLHQAEFNLAEVGDTYIDMASWDLGFVWVNGHLLGRHCRLGPQTRLYCPSGWLRQGRNEVIVLDMYARPGLAVAGLDKPETNVGVYKDK